MLSQRHVRPSGQVVVVPKENLLFRAFVLVSIFSCLGIFITLTDFAATVSGPTSIITRDENHKDEMEMLIQSVSSSTPETLVEQSNLILRESLTSVATIPGFDSKFRTVPSHATTTPPLNMPHHVMFSTSRSGHKSQLERVIVSNSQQAAQALPRTTFVFIKEDDPSVKKNVFGKPFIRDMFENVMKMYPHADTYTCFNDDIIFNRSFVDTMDGVVLAAKAGQISKGFLVVGRRSNLRWRSDWTFGTLNFDQAVKSAKLFQTNAEDYFTCSRDLWNWTDIPPFVIGRVAYDNWLVHKAVTSPHVSAIDATATNPVIHQTSAGGNFQGWSGEGWNANRVDLHYNTILARGKWYMGKTEHCALITSWDNTGKVVVTPRRRSETTD